MTDKIQKIKQEILRRKQSWQHSDKQYEHGGKDVCDYLLGFIDSLPEEPVSEDLEEEMIRWHKEHFGNERDWGKTSGEYFTRKSQLELALHFAEWQKQQMMKDALEITIVNDWQYGKDPDHEVIPSIHQRIDGLNVGDRVKIVICKTEQQ